MTEPAIVSIERDHPGDHDEVWIAEARRKAGERFAASVPDRYAEAVADCPEVVDWIRGLVAESVHAQRGQVATVRRGPSLLLLGPTGVGKTFQAYGALRALAGSGAQCTWMFTTAADLYARLRPRHAVDSEAEFRQYADAALLIVDDLGAAKGSEWVEEINYRLINHRYEHMLPTLITSNVPVSELAHALGDRAASRLAEMTTRAVLAGTDRRREHALTREDADDA